MLIIANYKNLNAVVSAVHEFVGFAADGEGNLQAKVRSYADMAAKESGVFNWLQDHPIPPASAADPIGWLVSSAGPFAGGSMVEQAGDLERAKVVKIAELKAKRDELETSGFDYFGMWFDSDAKAFNRMLGAAAEANAALAAGNTSFSKMWTLANNTTVPLAASDILELIPTLATRATELHVIYNARKAAVLAAESVEAVQSINWPIAPPPTVPETAE